MGLSDNIFDAYTDGKAALDARRVNAWAEFAQLNTDTLSNFDQSKKNKKRKLTTRFDAIEESRSNATFSDGDARYIAMLKSLDELCGTRTNVQKAIHFWCMQSILPHIYGKEWGTESLRVLRAHGLQKVNLEVFCLLPRRFGKTVAAALFALAAALHIPGFRVCIISTGMRASSGLASYVKSFLRQNNERVCRSTNEQLVIAPFKVSHLTRDAKNSIANESYCSKVSFYPATEIGMSLSLSLSLSLRVDGWNEGEVAAIKKVRIFHLLFCCKKTGASRKRWEETLLSVRYYASHSAVRSLLT